MTPKEKAKELFDKMTLACDNIDCHHSLVPYIKQCALIAVDEILEAKPSIDFWDSSTGMERRTNTEYWQQVKEEINQI